MDRLIENLITEAKAAGLHLQLDGRLLRIKGQRRSGAIAKELLDRKAEVIEFLAANVQFSDLNPETNTAAESSERTVTTEACPVCSTALHSEQGKDFLHVWCPAGHLDAWRNQKPEKSARQRVLEALERAECPECRERLDLQSKNHGVVYWCAGCRRHYTVSHWKESE